MSRLGRATIGLYNSYDPVNFREAHRRALARAGALSLAFDQNLATFGFPFPRELSTPGEISDWVATTTSIGENGTYLRKLTASGRFQTFPFPGKGFPPQLGEIVLTTSRPDEKRTTGVEEVTSLLLGGRSICLIFGLGPRGVPENIHRIAKQHLDISGGFKSLETCTAMGAVSAVIAHSVRNGIRQGGRGQ